MVMLKDEDILTREVLDWKGVHLIHFSGSSCSQKTRIFLHLKGIEWVSHHVDLRTRENYSDWFMGINPRGLVPVLVHDGRVIIESNDILTYLESEFPEPRLIPDTCDQDAQALLEEEDSLHLDLRTVCFRYFFPGAQGRSEEVLEDYQRKGSGTVGGVKDPHKEVELAFHRDLVAHNGVPDARIRHSAARFKASFEKLNTLLAATKYLLGDVLSLVDIAWYIYARRLSASLYPLHERHPHLGRWFDDLDARPEFGKEVAEPPKLLEMRAAMHKAQEASGTTLISVAGL